MLKQLAPEGFRGAVGLEPPFRYGRYAIGLLMLTYGANYMDRQTLSILMEPIRQDLHLSDSDLGFLAGFSFALFYATLGLPIATLADRSNRRNIIAASLVIFSAMTLVCGLATNVWQLALARVGVGVGEAGTSPASHSMIADIVPESRRAGAMGAYAVGANVGVLMAFLWGGWIAHAYGWRTAFFVLAMPGLVLAVLVRFTLREPVRGHAEGIVRRIPPPGFGRSFRELWAISSFRHIVLAVSLAVFAWQGVSTWAPAFLARSLHMSLGQIGAILALVIGVGGGAGTYASGVLTDRLGKRDIRWNMWLLCLIQVVCFPCAVGFYLATNQLLAVCFFLVPAFFGASYVAATLAMTQSLAPLPTRALASSLYLLVVNLIGQGLGPQVVGALSDLYRSRFGVQSLRYALLSVTFVWLWSAVHFWLAGRTLRRDIDHARKSNTAAEGLPA